MNTRARITVIPALLALTVGRGSLPNVFAHQTAAVTGTPPARLPELKLVVEEAGVTGMPESIDAGRYLVMVTGPAVGEMGSTGAVFAQLPDGVSTQEAYEAVQANPNDMPPWFLDAHHGGGAVLNQGTETWAVVDFTPGHWIVTTLHATTMGIEFEVTGELAKELPDAAANVTLDLHEMVIEISEGGFVAGDNAVTMENTGDQIHFVDITKIPDGTTREQVETLFTSLLAGTPAANGMQESDLVWVAYLADISPDVSLTVPVTLEAGTYILTCWIPDKATLIPHVMMGMWEIVVID